MVSQQVWIVRHGETEWSLSGAHTGRTDIPLTPRGRDRASRLRGFLQGHSFALVLTSPLQRARETSSLAGYAHLAEVEPDLREWDYGTYEGKKTAEIRKADPRWSIWWSAVPEGESLDEVARRAQRVIARITAAPGDVLLFAHGHILRILTAEWLSLPPDAGRYFLLDPASISILGYERENRVIELLNKSE